jgi:tRNA A58 N-methylase Trm61
MDAVFLDLPNPYDYLAQVRSALVPGGQFGTLLPTTNQITKLLLELKRNDFEFIDVCENINAVFTRQKPRNSGRLTAWLRTPAT